MAEETGLVLCGGRREAGTGAVAGIVLLGNGSGTSEVTEAAALEAGELGGTPGTSESLELCNGAIFCLRRRIERCIVLRRSSDGPAPSVEADM